MCNFVCVLFIIFKIIVLYIIMLIAACIKLNSELLVFLIQCIWDLVLLLFTSEIDSQLFSK